MDATLFTAGIVRAGVSIIAGQLGAPLTAAIHTEVPKRAGVSIITDTHRRRGRASSQPITGVLRTRITIIAFNGQTHADTGLTMVSYRAGISVETFSLIEGFMLASIRTCTGVDGTRVAIITGPLVDETITVIIQTIAGFSGGHTRITRFEPQLRADPLPSTRTRFVLLYAWCRKAVGYGQVATRAYPCRRYALVARGPRGGLHLLTCRPRRAWGVQIARTTAKRQPIRIAHTHAQGRIIAAIPRVLTG